MVATRARRCVCATHGHCFDGMASAALFSEALSRLSPGTEFSYVACGYSERQAAPEFDGDDNVILDYRYFADDRLTYYFDHHPTAFCTRDDERHFSSKRREAPKHFVFAPESGSCTKLLADHFFEHFGMEFSRFEDLIAWGEKIDTADFESVEEATDPNSKQLRLASVVTQFGDSDFLTRSIDVLRSEGLEALAGARFVKNAYKKLAPHYDSYNQRVRAQGKLSGRVVRVDLIDEPVSVITKFVQYREFPDATYSVVLARKSRSFVLSVGHNPWSAEPCDVDIGQICAQFGGGGHPYVGGISVAPGEGDRALAIADEVVQRLLSPEPSV